MKAKHIILWATCIWLATGCQKNIDQFEPTDEVTLPDNNWTAVADDNSDAMTMYNQAAPEVIESNITYEANTPTTANISDDLIIEIPAAAFEANGNLVSRGPIKIQVIILLKKGEWVRANRFTIGVNGRWLASHGIMLVRAFRENTELIIRPQAPIVFRYKFGNPETAMTFHTPVGPFTNNFFHAPWAPATTGKVSVVEIRNSATGLSEKVGYLVETKQMGWMSVARPATVPDQTAIVTVSLPHGFQNRNTNVYITPAKMPTLCYLTPDNNNKLWFNRSVPVRTPFMIFTITRHNNKYFLGQARSTEAGISAATHFAIRPQPVSFEELLKFLKNL